ncbi:MAG TPA: metallophosphoesterase family protein [Candidatus Saccharimonadales bacterium]|nr:metallophosphoesterase family protein [Candidatus Saccharimonadales bacterium]
MKIGVLSDTHNYLDPKIAQSFKSVRHILHAGDIGLPWILQELESVAPVTAVAGNTDDPALRYAATKAVALAGRKFFVQHIVQPSSLTENLRARLAQERPDVVVFGHTHQRFCETLAGVLYLNPGYAGRPKSGTDRSVAILHCDEKTIRAEYFDL